MQAQREVVRFLSAYQEIWCRQFPELHRRGHWHLVSHLCVRARDGAPMGELSGMVKQVFLLDDATVRERLAELLRLGFCTIDPDNRPVAARTLVVPTPLLLASFDQHLVEAASRLLEAGRALDPPLRGIAPTQVDAETRRQLLRAIDRCDESWMAALEQLLESMGLSVARRIEARRHLLSPSHRALTLAALRHRYGLPPADDGDGILADDMAAELLRLQRQNFQTTRDHIAALIQLGLLERRSGRALRVALAELPTAEFGRGLAQAAAELIAVAASFPQEDDVEQTGVSRLRFEMAMGDAPGRWHLMVKARDEEPGQRIALGSEPLVVGRAPSSGLVLAHHEVSRAHCRISVVAGSVNVTDLNSTNGTFIAGEQLSGTTILPAGAELSVGPFRLTCEQAPDDDVDGTIRPTPSEATARDPRAA